MARSSIAFASAALALIAGLTVVIVLASQEHARWVHWCEAQDGHVVDSSNVGTAVTVTNGKPGVGVSVSTTYYCLTADGRILGIES